MLLQNISYFDTHEHTHTNKNVFFRKLWLYQIAFSCCHCAYRCPGIRIYVHDKKGSYISPHHVLLKVVWLDMMYQWVHATIKRRVKTILLRCFGEIRTSLLRYVPIGMVCLQGKQHWIRHHCLYWQQLTPVYVSENVSLFHCLLFISTILFFCSSYRQISLSLEAARLDVIMIVSLLILTSISTAPLPRCLSNFRAIRKV